MATELAESVYCNWTSKCEFWNLSAITRIYLYVHMNILCMFVLVRISVWSASSHILSTMWLKRRLSSNITTDLSEDRRCDVMNLIMMNSWEATHVADHGLIDSELSSRAACLRGVLFGFQPYCRHSASLNHPLSIVEAMLFQ